MGGSESATQTSTERILKAIDFYPCDLLFIHRDAEKEPCHVRVEEIEKAIQEIIATGKDLPTHIAVVPVRMTET